MHSIFVLYADVYTVDVDPAIHRRIQLKFDVDPAISFQLSPLFFFVFFLRYEQSVILKDP